jgi:rhodanese-related sulfurtransferase
MTARVTTRFGAILAALVLFGAACAPQQAAPLSAPAPQAAPAKPAAQAPAAQPAAPAVAQLDVMATLDKALFGLPEGWAVVQPKALSEQIASAPPLLIDLREKSEVEKGYIAGAVNIPLRTLPDNLNALPADKAAPIVLYCGSGHRSAMALLTLRSFGYTNVKSMAGGTNNWTKEGLPLVTDPALPAASAQAAPGQFDQQLVAAYSAYYKGLPEGWGVVQPQALQEQIAATKPFLLDVREPSETGKGVIEGAVTVPIRGVAKNLDKLPADKAAPIVVYCGSGHRSAMVMETLRMAGYTNVKSLAGGTNNWTATGLTLTGGA